MNHFGKLGATWQADGSVHFLVWAPLAQQVEVELPRLGRRVGMEPLAEGYHAMVQHGLEPGDLYRFVLDSGEPRPDPASRHQPGGPHGPSAITPVEFPWTDHGWHGISLQNLVIYELHVGAFTREGTFDAIVPHLDDLRDLGITAIELMPIAQFPGNRNWGYDGVGLYAAQNSYGGPEGLRRLVNAAHDRGLAVILDVVYNHLGPEGNYLEQFGPYFTDAYRTPWGKALNFAAEHSDHVRRFFIENALYWITDCHIDGLRLDAVHAIVDPSPVPFVQELAQAVHRRAAELNRQVQVIAESASNDARVIQAPELGGIGADAQWNDDFHHALRAVLTGDLSGYYASFGRLEHLAAAFRHGYAYTGQYSAYHQRRHGSRTEGIPGSRFVVFAQNHDQVGNRMNGERLGQLVSLPKLKLAAAAVLLSPFVPLLFMGEEYGETAPFLYFVSHTDPDLVKAVRHGRKEEFASFGWQGEPPDPQAEETFLRCTLNHSLRQQGQNRALLEYYRQLLRLRRQIPALTNLDKDSLEVRHDEVSRTMLVRRFQRPLAGQTPSEALLLFNFGESEAPFAAPSGDWLRVLDSEDLAFAGRGSPAPRRMKLNDPSPLPLPPLSFALYINEGP